jgi:hypothetical protein
MTMPMALALTAAAALALGGSLQPAATKPAAPPDESAPAKAEAAKSLGVKAPLEALAFVRGTWTGTMGSDGVEETWSAPAGGSIVGMFRWMKDAKTTTMFELLAITHLDGVPTLRLRHFGETFDPWKGECDGVAAMRASVVEASRVVFSNEGGPGGLAWCEYHCPDPNTLRIVVVFKEASRPALRFELKRAN